MERYQDLSSFSYLQREGLDFSKPKVDECLHMKCTECKGTGIKKDGTPCIHMISCPCPRCVIVSL